MNTTTLSLKEICSDMEVCIAELGILEPELAAKISAFVSRSVAEHQRMKRDKIYREIKKSYY